MIVTNNPDEVSSRVMDEMARGITYLEGKGGYTGSSRPVLSKPLWSSGSRMKHWVKGSSR
jgi:hypothetical protein